MIRYNLKDLIQERSKKEGRTITASEIAAAIGIQRSAMSKMVRDEGYSTTTKTLDLLCDYFECEIEDLIWHDKKKTD